MYKIHCITSLTKDHIKEWNALWQKSPYANLFNSYEWLQTSIASDSITDYKIFFCYEKEKLVGVLPLTYSRCYGIRVLTSVGYRNVVDTAFLVEKRNSDLYEALFSKVFETDNLYLTTLDKDSSQILKKNHPEMLLSLMSVNPYIDFRTEEDPLRQMTSSDKRKIRSLQKKVGSDLVYKNHENPEEFEALFDLMCAVEAKSAKQRKAKEIFSDPYNVNFYKNMIKFCKKFIQVHFLYYKDEPIAYGFCIADRKTLYGYQTSYLFEYRKLSPGKLMLINLVEHIEKGRFTLFDLGGGISAYKQEFTPLYFFQFNLYYSRNLFIRLWWRSINTARRIKQIYWHTNYTRDHEFLFKTYENVLPDTF